MQTSRLCRFPDIAPEQDRKARTLVAQNIGEGTALREQGSKLQITRPGGEKVQCIMRNAQCIIRRAGGGKFSSLFVYIIQTGEIEVAKEWQSRQVRLIGEEKTDILANKRIMVCGLGGVGGNCCEALCRAGVGTLILIDNDTVNETNINRQDFATAETTGMKKTDAAAKRLLSINPELDCILLDTFLSPDNIPRILEEHKPDYVIDAIDNVTAKVSLAVECQRLGIPLVASMGTGNKLNPEMLKISDISKTSVCPLARVMRKKMKELGVKKYEVLWSDEVPITPDDGDRTPASISFVPPCAGIMIAGRVIRNILNM